MKIRWYYILLFALAVCGVAYMSIPTEETLIAMSREDGNLPRVRELLKRHFDREPGNLKVALDLAGVCREMDDYAGEMEALRVAYRHHPGEVRVQREFASALVDGDEIEDALAVLPPERRDREFLLRTVAYYDKMGDLARAEEMLLAAEKDNLDKPLVWIIVAEWRADLYNLEGEAEALRRALRADPKNQAAWERYFVNRAWQLDVDETLSAAAELEGFAPLDRGHLETVYDFQLSRRDVDGAILTLEKMSRLPGVDPAAKVDYAVLLYRQGAAEKADRVLLGLLASPEGLTRQASTDAISYLRESAQTADNLELALRLAALPADPDVKRANQMAVVEIALATNRVEEARGYFKAALADPDAPADVILMGLNLAYRDGDFAALPGLVDRLNRAANPGADDTSIDGVVYAALENDRPMDFWQEETRRVPGSASAWTALARVAVRQGNAVEAGRAVDAGLRVLDRRDFIDSFSLLESLVYLGGIEPDGSPDQRARYERAMELADAQMDGPLSESRWFLAMAADLNERRGRDDVAEELWRRISTDFPDDVSSMLGLARAAAGRGDEAAVDSVLRRYQAREAATPAPVEEVEDAEDREAGRPGEIRSLVYACLALFDYYSQVDNADPARAQPWLDRAGTLMADHAGILPDADPDNVYLRAELAERNKDWTAAHAYWLRAARAIPENVNAWLGMARAASGMENPDLAWQALTQAAKLDTTGLDVQLQLAWQSLTASAELPEDHPERAARRAWAEDYAAARLKRQWEPDLAAALVFRALENEDLAKARSFLNRSWEAPSEVHAALAEAFLATALLEQAKSDVKVTEFHKQALAEATAASVSNDRSILMRMAYVLSELNEKDRLRALLARIEAIPGEEDPDHLRQLADAYGFLENYPRQFELVERRARLGGVPEWLDAIDRHAWAGDYEGGFRLLEEAERLYPDAVELTDRWLAFLGDNNRPGQVLEVYERARNRNPEIEAKLSADALAAVGVAYDDLRSTPQARRFFRLSLEKEPGNKRGSMGQARLLRRDGNLAGAIRALRLYVAGTPDDPWGWLELANTRADAEQVGRQEYLKVVELTEPDRHGDIPTDVRAARGVALRQLGREKEALALFEDTVGPVITDPNVACDFAQMLMEIRKYDEAEDILRRTVKAFPYHVWAYRLESTILVRRQKYDLAVARLKEALLWAPSDGEVQRDLGFAAQLWERTWQSQKNWLAAGGR